MTMMTWTSKVCDEKWEYLTSTRLLTCVRPHHCCMNLTIRNEEEEGFERQAGGDMDEEDEDDVNDELALPDVLSTLSWKEKKELLAYKRAHTDVSVYLVCT